MLPLEQSGLMWLRFRAHVRDIVQLILNNSKSAKIESDQGKQGYLYNNNNITNIYTCVCVCVCVGVFYPGPVELLNDLDFFEKEFATMTHPSKDKGNRFERELVRFFESSGIPAKRAYASNGESLGHHATVDVLAGGKRLQAKRRGSIAKWLKVSENQDAVVVREDRGETYVVLTLAEYANLIYPLTRPDPVKAAAEWYPMEPISPASSPVSASSPTSEVA